MDGLHLTADLRGCAPDRALLTDPAVLREVCLDAVAAAGLQRVGELFHGFGGPPASTATSSNGITGVVLLAESHVAVHTWPELAAATLDVYVCNVGIDNSARAHALFEALLDAFGAASIERNRLRRGAVDAPAVGDAIARGMAVQP